MKRSIIKSFVIILLLVCAVSAAFAGSKKRTMHPKEMYDHSMHTENFFTPAGVPCESCHVNDAYEWKGMNKDGCHQCHAGRKNSPVPGPSDCSMCHANWTVEPSDHKIGWQETHKARAQADKKWCENCHTDRFCITCHQQRTTIELFKHKRNYTYFHSIDARADPKKCDRCHQVSYCTKCHSSPRPLI